MEERRKIRYGFILVTLSSLIILLTLAFSISGFLHVNQVVYKNEDFNLNASGELIKNHTSPHLEILIFNFYSDSTIDIDLVVMNDKGHEIFNQSGESTTRMDVPIEKPDDYIIIIRFDDPGDDPDDLEIEVQQAGVFFFMMYCSSACCLFLIFLTVIITGAVFTFSGYSGMRSNCGRYTR